MAERLTVSAIRALYEAIAEANKTLPNFDEVDFETKWYVMELLRRDILGIGSDEEAGDGKTISEQIEELRTLIAGSLSYDQAGFYVGQPSAGLKLFAIPVTRAFTLPANCAGSYAKCATAPYASATFFIKKNGFQIGTFTFPAGILSATFACDETEFIAGDVLEVWAPATADTDLADPCWNFKINMEIS